MEKELTRSELKLMNVLWDRGHAFVQEMIGALPDPKPANSTVSTMMRILVGKGFAGIELFGKNNRYYPLVSRGEYTSTFMRRTRDNLFGGSMRSMMSFFAEGESLSAAEIDELIGILNECKQQQP